MHTHRACEAAVSSLVDRITLCYNTIELQDAAILGKGHSQAPGSLVGKLIEDAISFV